MGHFGVKMKRSRDGGATWEERPVPQYPPKPDDVVDVDPMRNTPIPWNVMKVWALEGSQRDRRALVRHDSGRAVPLARRRRHAGSSSRACGSIRTASSGSAAAPTIPASTRSSSTRAAPTSCGSACRAAACGSAPTAARRGTARARACAPTTRRPTRRTSAAARTPHRVVAVRRGPGQHLDPAPQRHLPQHRRRADVHGDHERAAVGVRLPRRRASRGARTPRGSCRARRISGAIPSTARSSSRARATAARASRC